MEQYLVFAEGQAMRRIRMHMKDWVRKLDAFLTLNDRDILNHAGQISHKMTMELADKEYRKYCRQRIKRSDQLPGDFEKAIEYSKRLDKDKPVES